MSEQAVQKNQRPERQTEKESETQQRRGSDGRRKGGSFFQKETTKGSRGLWAVFSRLRCCTYCSDFYAFLLVKSFHYGLFTSGTKGQEQQERLIHQSRKGRHD